jgi:hypothetical protein
VSKIGVGVPIKIPLLSLRVLLGSELCLREPVSKPLAALLTKYFPRECRSKRQQQQSTAKKMDIMSSRKLTRPTITNTRIASPRFSPLPDSALLSSTTCRMMFRTTGGVEITQE